MLRRRGIGQAALGKAPFPPGPVQIAITAADQAKSTRRGASCGKVAAACQRHGGQYQRQFQTKLRGQAGRDHSITLPVMQVTHWPPT